MSLICHICREFGIDYLKVKIDGTDTFQGRLVKGPKTNQYRRDFAIYFSTTLKTIESFFGESTHPPKSSELIS